MNTVTIERHSEKHYTIRGKSIFGSEVIEYVCSGYLDQRSLYDRVDRKEATELTVLVKLSDEPQEETHRRLREEVALRASVLMANIPIPSMITVEATEPKKMLE